VSGRRASVGAREGARAVLGCARALEGHVDDYGVPGGAARRARAGRVTAGGRICSRGGPLSPRRSKGRSYSSVRRRAPVGVLTQGTEQWPDRAGAGGTRQHGQSPARRAALEMPRAWAPRCLGTRGPGEDVKPRDARVGPDAAVARPVLWRAGARRRRCWPEIICTGHVRAIFSPKI
jgi:hypothetical protein